MRRLRVRVCSELWCGDWKSVRRHFQRALCEGPTPGQAWLGPAIKEMKNPFLVPLTAGTDFQKEELQTSHSVHMGRVWKLVLGRTEPGKGAGSHPLTLKWQGKVELPWESFLSWVVPALLSLLAAPSRFSCHPKHTEDKAGPFQNVLK